MTKRLDPKERIALAATVLATVAAGAPALLHSAQPSVDAALDSLRRTVHRDPLKATLGTVLVSATMFHAAERGHNPKIETFEDALVYCSTCLSVGYDRTFPVTRNGKRIATLLMALGPALAARALDPPQR